MNRGVCWMKKNKKNKRGRLERFFDNAEKMKKRLENPVMEFKNKPEQNKRIDRVRKFLGKVIKFFTCRIYTICCMLFVAVSMYFGHELLIRISACLIAFHIFFYVMRFRAQGLTSVRKSLGIFIKGPLFVLAGQIFIVIMGAIDLLGREAENFFARMLGLAVVYLVIIIPFAYYWCKYSLAMKTSVANLTNGLLTVSLTIFALLMDSVLPIFSLLFEGMPRGIGVGINILLFPFAAVSALALILVELRNYRRGKYKSRSCQSRRRARNKSIRQCKRSFPPRQSSVEH